MNTEHPMQPIEIVDQVVRFKSNPIVRYLLDAGPFSLDDLALLPCSLGDREQFAQLIGCSVDRFANLSYVRRESVTKADELFKQLRSTTKPA